MAAASDQARNTRMAWIAALALALSACGGGTDADPGVEEPIPSAPVVDWDDPSVVADLGDGWQLHACTGDGPFLCADHDGAEVGAFEALAFDAASFDAFDPGADNAANLAAFAGSYLGTFEEDRREGCGAGYGFEPVVPHAVEFDGRQAIAYGFVGTLAGGNPSEAHVQFATIADGRLLILSGSGYDDGGCPGRQHIDGFTSADILQLRDPVERLLPDIPIPELPTPPPPP